MKTSSSAALLFFPSPDNRVIYPARGTQGQERLRQDSREEARNDATNGHSLHGITTPKELENAHAAWWDISRVHGVSNKRERKTQGFPPATRDLEPISSGSSLAKKASVWQQMVRKSQENQTSGVSNQRRGIHSKAAQRTKLQSLESKTRLYGGGSGASPAPQRFGSRKRSLLNPLQQIHQEKKLNDRQEALLARALEGKIDRMGVTIPVKFLVETQHIAFAERMVLNAMCKVLARHYVQVVHGSFAVWKRRMISLHILEEYERQVLLTRQTSIAHACAIIQRKQHIRMRGFLLHWYRLTLGIRAAEQNHCANVIQRYWRKFRLLMNFRWLTQEYRAFVRRVSATKVQAAARRFLAIRAFQRLLFEHRRFVAAIRIQKCYGNYQICKIAQRQRQQDAVLSIQRVWRGHRGRNRAKYRQQLLRRVAEKMVLGIWRETALKRVRVKRVLVTRIQHCVRVFTFRCRVARAFVQNRRRCLFLPALRIQNAWHTYRQSEIFRSVYAMVAIIVEQRESAASLIQMKFKRYYHWKQERSAGIITKLLRAFKSRKIVMARQLEWLHGWSTLNFLRWEGHCPLAMQRWSALTARVERGLHDIEYDQHHALKRLNVFEGVRFVLLIKCFHKDFLADNAVKIQVNWRWHHFRSVMRKRMQAALLIQRSIPLLHKAYKKRQQRKRVLGRWKRQRYCSMKASFQQWRVFQKLIQEARSLKVTNESLRRMKWFRHQKLRKGMMTRWKIFIECRHERARRLEQAIELNALHTKRRFWRVWLKDRLPDLIVKNRLSELKLVLHAWQQLNFNRMNGLKKKKATEWHIRHQKQTALSVWKMHVQDMRVKMLRAERHNEYRIAKRSFAVLRRYATLNKQVEQSRRKMYNARGIRQWVLRMCFHRQAEKWKIESLKFYEQSLKKQSWAQWCLYLMHRRKYRAKLVEMDQRHIRSNMKTAIAQWSERVPVLKDMRFITNLADDFYNTKLKQHIFRVGFFRFWALTVGARRVQMVNRIQRAYRSKRARKKLFALRTKFKYQLEARVTKGLDVVEFTSETLVESLRQPKHLWVFALVTYPWQPVSSDWKEAFNKVATNWRYLRTKRMLFGFADATATITCASPPDEELEYEGKPTHYSLLSWLGIDSHCFPCIVAFWQGVSSAMWTGAAALDAPKSVQKRRFKRVCEDASEPSLVFQVASNTTVANLMEWIDALQRTSCEATAIDLQSYIRVFLACRIAAKLRAMRRERMAMRIQNWFTRLRLKWFTRETNRAVQKLQRWFHGIQKRRLFWRDFQAAMTMKRNAANAIRRITKRFFSRKRFKTICRLLVATTSRFPNSPLCEECFSESAESHTFTLATLKCRSCTQALCLTCFIKLHQSGKRLLHLADTIETAAMNDPNKPMCGVCEVASCKKFCTTCNLGSEGEVRSTAFCGSCFELAHSDHNVESGQAKSKKHRLRSWWQSESFRSHSWYRSNSLALQETQQTASIVVSKYQWMTLNLYLTQQEEVQKAERSQKAREGELFAIRMQHEAILRDAFNRYDSDQSGYIDKQEFKRMFKEELCQPLKDDQVDDAMDAMDKSGDGKIQFDELLQWFAEGVLDNNASVASPASDMLKEALKATRKMRRYKEKLHELLPPVPSIKDQLSILNSTEKVVVAKVPGFSSVDCLEAYDYTNKRRVFYRFLKEILQIEWIEEDEAIIPIENAIEVFNNVFLPRWNAGELTFDFYFDDESFAFDGTEWTRRWDSQAKKYFFHTTRMVRKVSKLQRDGSDAAGNTRRRSRRGTSARKKSIRRASVKTQREDTRDSHGPTAAVQAEEEDGWVEEEVMERIDPRRKQSLWDDAKRAFASADQDASGFIDVKEFHSMLVSELCEPILKSKAKAIMNQIDADGSGKIDFDEFFLWYATDKCQDYPTTPQIERVRALLKTKRRARATAMAAVDASITGSLKVKQAVEETLKTQQLVRDCKGASPELVTLLQEGFPKLLASKALTLHHQDVDSARAWLTEKQQEEQHEKDLVIKEREQRKAMRKRAAHEAALNRKKRIARMKKMMKMLLLGADKEEVHATEIQDTLENLDREILLVDQQLSANAIAKAKIHGKS